jgi:hypothetical protein
MYTKEEIKQAWDLAHDKGIRYFGDVGTNAKTIKSDKKTNYLSYIMYLAPATQSGKYNVCPMASAGCANACLYTAGHGAIPTVKEARIRRTLFWFEHREAFKACLFDELTKHRDKCKKLGKKCAARLNGTSDIVWERVWPELFDWFRDIQFYDYSKIYPRLMPNYQLPKNYHLTLSRSETNQSKIEQVLQANPKANVTVVFDKLPKKWMGRRVIDGDLMDARFLDPRGVVVGLKTKGDGRKDETGFVVRETIAPLSIKGKVLQVV